MTGKININGQIGSFDNITGVELIDVISQVKAQPNATGFNVYINSEGGLVDVGFDIHNYLKALGKPINTIGSGMVASIATVIFMAGARRQILPNTQFMIHNPFGAAQGNADDLKVYLSELQKVEKQILDFYKSSLNLEDEALVPLLRNETWLTQDQLNVLGFVNSEPLKIEAKAVFKINNKNEMNMTEQDKSWIESTFNALLAKFQKKPIAKMVQDSTGVTLDFAELGEDEPITVGAMATVEGAPADGEYVMPSGETYVFTAGELTEIVAAEGDNEEMADLKRKLEEANAALEAKNSESSVLETENKELKAKNLEIEKDVKAFKAQITSKFEGGGKKEGKKPQNNTDRSAGLKEYLKEKKGK